MRSVRALPGYRLEVCFVDGVVGEVDLSALIASPDAGVFGALREGATFAQVLVVDGAVSWPGGQDLAPDAMHDEIARNGRWVVR